MARVTSDGLQLAMRYQEPPYTLDYVDSVSLSEVMAEYVRRMGWRAEV